MFEVTFLSKILRELFITFFQSDDFRKFTDEELHKLEMGTTEMKILNTDIIFNKHLNVIVTFFHRLNATIRRMQKIFLRIYTILMNQLPLMYPHLTLFFF